MSNPLELLGARIAELRKAKGLTQKELGDALGVSAGAVSQWEGGRIDIPYMTQTRIALALRVNVAALSDSSPPPRSTPSRASETRLALLRAIMDADDDRIDRIATVLSSILPAWKEKKPGSTG